MNKKDWKNIYFCIIFPTFTAGVATIGTYSLFEQVATIYPTPFLLLCSGGVGYLIGSLIRSKFKWEDKQ